MLNESVIKVLKNGMWDLATCANGEPNVVSVAFKDVTDDGKLVVGDVFLEITLNNIKIRYTNKFHSNFKRDHLQAIIKPINSLKVICHVSLDNFRYRHWNE